MCVCACVRARARGSVCVCFPLTEVNARHEIYLWAEDDYCGVNTWLRRRQNQTLSETNYTETWTRSMHLMQNLTIMNQYKSILTRAFINVGVLMIRKNTFSHFLVHQTCNVIRRILHTSLVFFFNWLSLCNDYGFELIRCWVFAIFMQTISKIDISQAYVFVQQRYENISSRSDDFNAPLLKMLVGWNVLHNLQLNKLE